MSRFETRGRVASRMAALMRLERSASVREYRLGPWPTPILCGCRAAIHDQFPAVASCSSGPQATGTGQGSGACRSMSSQRAAWFDDRLVGDARRNLCLRLFADPQSVRFRGIWLAAACDRAGWIKECLLFQPIVSKAAAPFMVKFDCALRIILGRQARQFLRRLLRRPVMGSRSKNADRRAECDQSTN